MHWDVDIQPLKAQKKVYNPKEAKSKDLLKTLETLRNTGSSTEHCKKRIPKLSLHHELMLMRQTWKRRLKQGHTMTENDAATSSDSPLCILKCKSLFWKHVLPQKTLSFEQFSSFWFLIILAAKLCKQSIKHTKWDKLVEL